jgi:hypothetical protein
MVDNQSNKLGRREYFGWPGNFATFYHETTMGIGAVKKELACLDKEA